MIAGPEVDITTSNRPTEHEQRVRTVVAVVTNDHAGVVAGEQGEVERVDVERDPLFPDVDVGPVGVSLAANLDVGDLVVVTSVGEDRLEAGLSWGRHGRRLSRRWPITSNDATPEGSARRGRYSLGSVVEPTIAA